MLPLKRNGRHRELMKNGGNFLPHQLLWEKDGTMISRAFFMDGIDLKMASPAELAKLRGSIHGKIDERTVCRDMTNPKLILKT